MNKETKKLRIMFAKSGSGSITTRISLPKTWINEMNIDSENRDVKVTYEDNKIIIEKLNI